VREIGEPRPEASNHNLSLLSLVDFIIIMSGSRFSAHSGMSHMKGRCAGRERPILAMSANDPKRTSVTPYCRIWICYLELN
jgi:hypothetical protein